MESNYKAYMFKIAGVQHAQYKEALEAGLKEDAELTLVLEPTNQYDPEAVMICWNSLKLGYVPKLQEDLKKSLHKRGEPLEGCRCALKELQEDSKPWEMFVVICEVEDV